MVHDIVLKDLLRKREKEEQERSVSTLENETKGTKNRSLEQNEDRENSLAPKGSILRDIQEMQKSILMSWKKRIEQNKDRKNSISRRKESANSRRKEYPKLTQEMKKFMPMFLKKWFDRYESEEPKEKETETIEKETETMIGTELDKENERRQKISALKKQLIKAYQEKKKKLEEDRKNKDFEKIVSRMLGIMGVGAIFFHRTLITDKKIVRAGFARFLCFLIACAFYPSLSQVLVSFFLELSSASQRRKEEEEKKTGEREKSLDFVTTPRLRGGFIRFNREENLGSVDPIFASIALSQVVQMWEEEREKGNLIQSVRKMNKLPQAMKKVTEGMKKGGKVVRNLMPGSSKVGSLVLALALSKMEMETDCRINPYENHFRREQVHSSKTPPGMSILPSGETLWEIDGVQVILPTLGEPISVPRSTGQGQKKERTIQERSKTRVKKKRVKRFSDLPPLSDSELGEVRQNGIPLHGSPLFEE